MQSKNVEPLNTNKRDRLKEVLKKGGTVQVKYDVRGGQADDEFLALKRRREMEAKQRL